MISIHSLRVEGDECMEFAPLLQDGISIHSLRVEGDPDGFEVVECIDGFQSTPSVWRETAVADQSQSNRRISIHSLRVEGDRQAAGAEPGASISIHSLRVEGDRVLAYIAHAGNAFQSTPSVWRETDS